MGASSAAQVLIKITKEVQAATRAAPVNFLGGTVHGSANFASLENTRVKLGSKVAIRAVRANTRSRLDLLLARRARQGNLRRQAQRRAARFVLRANSKARVRRSLMDARHAAVVISRSRPEDRLARRAKQGSLRRRARRRAARFVRRANIKISLRHKLMGASSATVGVLPIRRVVRAARLVE